MRRETDQGQSLATIDKERRIGAALAIGMRIASASPFAGKGFRFWHFDANAGSGFNDAIGVPGSPIVFWEAANRHLRGLEPSPFFCDINTTHMRALQQALIEKGGPSILLPGDNDEALLHFGKCIEFAGDRPAFAVGTVVVDPNGYYYRNKQNIGVPIRALNWFLPRFPRMDVVLNLNTRTYRMQKAHGHDVLAPRDLLASLHKRYWLVGLTSHGGDTFLIAIGRNMATGDYQSAGLYKAHSAIGEGILNAAEGGRQFGLDLAVSDIQRVPTASRVSRRAVDSNAPRKRAVLVRQGSDRGAPR
jgi:hypothetical protein